MFVPLVMMSAVQADSEIRKAVLPDGLLHGIQYRLPIGSLLVRLVQHQVNRRLSVQPSKSLHVSSDEIDILLRQRTLLAIDYPDQELRIQHLPYGDLFVLHDAVAAVRITGSIDECHVMLLQVRRQDGHAIHDRLQRQALLYQPIYLAEVMGHLPERRRVYFSASSAVVEHADAHRVVFGTRHVGRNRRRWSNRGRQYVIVDAR